MNLESAKDHCDRVENDYEISLDSIKNQLESVKEAKEAVNNEESNLVDKALNNIWTSIDQE